MGVNVNSKRCAGCSATHARCEARFQRTGKFDRYGEVSPVLAGALIRINRAGRWSIPVRFEPATHEVEIRYSPRPATDWPPKPRQQTAITVVNHRKRWLFLLIFSFAIYVRDAGVAGSNPATPTSLFTTLSVNRDSYRDSYEPDPPDPPEMRRGAAGNDTPKKSQSKLEPDQFSEAASDFQAGLRRLITLCRALATEIARLAFAAGPR